MVEDFFGFVVYRILSLGMTLIVLELLSNTSLLLSSIVFYP